MFEESKIRENIRNIIFHYGIKAQSMQTAEECSELIVALSKYNRKFLDADRQGKIDLLKAIIEEIADVKIMLMQYEEAFGCQEVVEQIISEKVERQMKRIEDEEKLKGNENEGDKH